MLRTSLTTAVVALSLVIGLSATADEDHHRGIIVVHAIYRANDNAGEANITDQVRDLCRDTREECTVPCDNGTYGDPTPGHHKFCEVIYRCRGEDETKSARAAENTALSMHCRRDRY